VVVVAGILEGEIVIAVNAVCVQNIPMHPSVPIVPAVVHIPMITDAVHIHVAAVVIVVVKEGVLEGLLLLLQKSGLGSITSPHIIFFLFHSSVDIFCVVRIHVVSYKYYCSLNYYEL